MEKSLFKQYVDKWFKPIVSKVVEKINGKEAELTYMWRNMLKKVYSPTLKWSSLSSNNTHIAADVVSMNSSLPLKKRDALRKAEGDIPKIGMKLALDERTMTDLDILERTNQNNDRTNEIIKKLFGDTKKCTVGVLEQLEFMFLQALSTGVTVIEDKDKNTGIGIRIDFGHPKENKFGAVKPWSDNDSAKAVSDIERIMDRASEKGHTPRYLLMDRGTFKNLRKNPEVKELFAASMGFAGQNIPTPTLSQVNDVMNDNYNLKIVIIDRSVAFEKNGKRTSVKPWSKNVVVFLDSMDVGDLSWGTLAEENHPVSQVSYQKADDFILLSKYHKNDPLQEFTSSQALAVPVIHNVDSIYMLDSEEAETEEQTEGDSVFNYEGTDYTKSSVVAAINLANEDLKAKASNADSTLQSKINKLSEAEIEVFEENIEEPA